MEDCLIEQEVSISAVNRALQSFRKRPAEEVTLAMIEGRRSQLQQHCRKCETLDVKINTLAKNSDKSLITYFSVNTFLEAEEAYLNSLDFFNDSIAKLKHEEPQPTSTRFSIRSRACFHRVFQNYLVFDLPKFDVDYLSWQNYHDLFQSIIAEDLEMPAVQKMHYLKSSLEGEAAQLIKHMGFPSDNYNSAWATLKKRYANQRVIINSHLNSIMNIAIITTESLKELKHLRNTSAEAVQALKNLGYDISDTLLVFIIVGKLAKPSIIEWEKLLGDRTDYPKYQELENFLAVRIRTLEAIEASKDNQKHQPSKTNNRFATNQSQNKIGSSRSFALTTAKLKCLCDSNHFLYQCDKFKMLPVKDKRIYLKEKIPCYNCFRLGHNASKCSWKMVCKKCKGKHNTLLHFERPVEVHSKTKSNYSRNNEVAKSSLDTETS